jgi:hypothetical protein
MGMFSLPYDTIDGTVLFLLLLCVFLLLELVLSLLLHVACELAS